MALEKTENYTALKIWRGLFVTALFILGAIAGFQAGLLIVSWVSNPSSTNTFVMASRESLDTNSGRTTALIAFTLLGALFARLISSPAFVKLVQAGDRLKEMKPNEKVATFSGVLVGLLLTIMLRSAFPIMGVWVTVVVGGILVYLGIVATWSMKDELRIFLPGSAALSPDGKEVPPEQCKILDTNVIIDGRVADICRTGFIEGPIYVPGFVLDELQHIADSADSLKRARGRRGLDILNQMRTELDMMVRTYDNTDPGDRDEVDAKLVKLAKKLNGKIVTNDYNLNKVAELQGVPVLNINELANAVKPIVLPGEEMLVTIIKEGKEQNQGVAYLEDGTMIVVEGGRRRIGETLPVVTSSVLQTVAGKMIFANIRGDEEEEDDGGIRMYPRGGPPPDRRSTGRR
ncbi:MAG: PIN/TRAM domain-containing protein [Janthinobacterium lividum]